MTVKNCCATDNSRSPLILSNLYVCCIWADRWNGRHEPVTIQHRRYAKVTEQPNCRQSRTMKKYLV